MKQLVTIYLSLGLGLMILTIGVSYTIFDGADAIIRRSDAEIRALGYSLDPDDYVPKPVPDDEDAALVFREAFALFTDTDTYRACLYRDVADRQISEVEALLRSNAKGLSTFIRATRMKSANWGRNPRDPLGIDWPNYYESTNYISLLELVGWLALQNGDTDAALSAIEASLRVADFGRKVEHPDFLTLVVSLLHKPRIWCRFAMTRAKNRSVTQFFIS